MEKSETDLEKAKADVKALQALLQLGEEKKQTEREALIDLIKRADYGEKPVYVIGHKSPDSDTVCSAIGMAYLLNSLGISAEARIAAELNIESEYAFEELSIIHPEILEDAVIKEETESGNEADLLIYSVYNVDYSDAAMGFGGKNMEFAKEIMEGAFSGNSGTEGSYYLFSPTPSRKMDVVPAIEGYLNTLKN